MKVSPAAAGGGGVRALRAGSCFLASYGLSHPPRSGRAECTGEREAWCKGERLCERLWTRVGVGTGVWGVWTRGVVRGCALEGAVRPGVHERGYRNQCGGVDERSVGMGVSAGLDRRCG